MKDFKGRLAVISGGGSGMGQELVCQLAAEGCNVAFCDVRTESLQETLAKAQKIAPSVKITGHVCDVSKESDWSRFRDEVLSQHNAKCVHFLANGAGIGGATSMFTTARDEWERVFNISWFGVYYGCRTFLPLLKAAPEGHVVNFSRFVALSHDKWSASDDRSTVLRRSGLWELHTLQLKALSNPSRKRW